MTLDLNQPLAASNNGSISDANMRGGRQKKYVTAARTHARNSNNKTALS